MTDQQLAAVVDVIKVGCLVKDSPLSVFEFEAIHRAILQRVMIAERKLAVKWLADEQQALREHSLEVAKEIR